jgi:hypothetical protein
MWKKRLGVLLYSFLYILLLSGCRETVSPNEPLTPADGDMVYQEVNLEDYYGFFKAETGLQMLYAEEIFYNQEFQDYNAFNFLHVIGEQGKVDMETLLGKARRYRLGKTFFLSSMERINYHLNQISPDGKRALFFLVEDGTDRIKEEIVDLASNEILFEYDYKERNLAQYQLHQFTPNLDAFLEYRAGGSMLVRIRDRREFPLPFRLDGQFSIYDFLFSPDGQFLAFLKYMVTEENDYSSENPLRLCVINLETGELAREISIGTGAAQLSQWHVSDKLLYNLNEKGYCLDLKTQTIVYLGAWMFRPMLSPDGANLAYTHPVYEHVGMLCNDDQIALYEAQNEYGIYLLDLSSGKTTRLSELVGEDLYALDWIGLDTPKLSLTFVEGQPWAMMCPAVLSASSNAPGGEPELVLDRDYTTAWMEGVEGDGLGEWLEISFVEYDDRGRQIPLSQPIWNMAVAPCIVNQSADFYVHNRIHMLQIDLSDGSRYIEELMDDEEDFMQGVVFDQIHEVQWIRLTIINVYPGETRYDTGITEIQFNYP